MATSSVPKLPLIGQQQSTTSSRAEGRAHANTSRISRAGAEKRLFNPQSIPKPRISGAATSRKVLNEESGWKFFDKGFNFAPQAAQRTTATALPPLPPKLLDTPIGASEGLETILANQRSVPERQLQPLDITSSGYNSSLAAVESPAASRNVVVAKPLSRIPGTDFERNVGPRSSTDPQRIVAIPAEKMKRTLVNGNPVFYGNRQTAVSVTDKLAKSQYAVPKSSARVKSLGRRDSRLQASNEAEAEIKALQDHLDDLAEENARLTKSTKKANSPSNRSHNASTATPPAGDLSLVESVMDPPASSFRPQQHQSLESTFQSQPVHVGDLSIAEGPTPSMLADALAQRSRLAGEVSQSEVKIDVAATVRKMPKGFGAIRHNPPLWSNELRDVRALGGDPIPDPVAEAAIGRLHVSKNLKKEAEQVPRSIMGLTYSSGETPPGTKEEDTEELLAHPMRALEKMVTSCIETLCDFAPLAPDEEGYAEERLETMALLRAQYQKLHPISGVKIASLIPSEMVDSVASVQKGGALVRVEHESVYLPTKPNSVHLQQPDAIIIDRGHGGPLLHADLPSGREDRLAYLREKQREAEIHFGLRAEFV